MNSDERNKVVPSDIRGARLDLEAAQREKLLNAKVAAKSLGQKSDELQGSWTLTLLLALLAATASSFQFGYHIGCINVPAKVIIQWYVDSYQYLYQKSIFAIGGMVGGLASGWFADRMGRKGAMLFNNIIAVIAAVFMTGAKYVNTYHFMIIGRFVIGIHSGLCTGLVPLYLTEISPINLRGTLGSAHQLFITIAILFSQIVGLPSVLGGATRWHMVFAFTIVPVLVQVVLFFLCPESPKYNLIIKNRAEQAEKDLQKLRGREDVSMEMEAMKEEAAVVASMEKIGMKDLFKGDYAWPIFIAIMMMCGQQFSGINVAIFFSTQIFSDAGLGEGALYATLGMGVLNVAMTLVSVYLVDHPKCGRRLLLLIGFTGMLITSVLLVISISLYNSDPVRYSFIAYGSMLFVFLFVVSFATGPGSIPWFFVTELFASAARSNASSIAVMVNWTANFIVGTSFESLNQHLEQYAFLVFSTLLAFFIFFTWMYVPETKGRTVEEINAEFRLGKSRFARRNY
ncbi:unnamed protein product [Dracunculus medinensis]|uniref:MFS domain-containing protein n=1 Tax=Dracunculus medinensis TaxID=318479 RepID=A0A0N4UK09_DRAME|nr:unnamed protein product [Dracunculus medinensis]